MSLRNSLLTDGLIILVSFLLILSFGCSDSRHITRFLQDTVYVDGERGDDKNDGFHWATAVKTIQRGLDLATDGMRVLVADGLYSGIGNKNLDFKGKAIHLLSVGGAGSCIIDCAHDGRGFYFHTGEGNDSVVEGFTVRNGDVRRGGGFGCWNGSSPRIVGCVISGNSADYGGGVYAEGSYPILENCIVENNTAENYGGGVCCRDGADMVITDCVIRGNTAGWGGGIYTDDSDPLIKDTTVACNDADAAGGGIGCWNYSLATMENLDVFSNTATFGGGIYAHYSPVLIVNCRSVDNIGSAEGGGFFFYSDGGALLKDSIAEKNESFSGAGIHCGYQSSPLIINCSIRHNTAYHDGGGLHAGFLSSISVVNCEIFGNGAPAGGGVYCYEDSTPIFVNCTITDNDVSVNGGGVYVCFECNATLNNTIIWGNTVGTVQEQFYAESDSTVLLDHCDVGAGLAGAGIITQNGCISTDPMFIDPSSDDYRLKSASDCVDAGDNTLIPNGVVKDLAGNERIVNGVVDIGAYEHQGR